MVLAAMDPLRAQQLAAELEVEMMADMYNRCGPAGEGIGGLGVPEGVRGLGDTSGCQRHWGTLGCWGCRGVRGVLETAGR